MRTGSFNSLLRRILAVAVFLLATQGLASLVHVDGPASVRELEATYLSPFRTWKSQNCTISATAATCSITLSPAVVVANTVIVPNGNNSSDTGAGSADLGEWFTTCELTSTTNITCTRAVTTATVALVVYVTVWENSPIYLKQAVQRGTIALNASTTSATAVVTAVDTSKANVVPCGYTTSGVGAAATRGGANSPWWDFSDTTHVRFQRNAQNGVVLVTGCYQIVERR